MRWVVAGLLAVVGGYLVVDSMRALTVGDFLTPGSGDHAGELGPWATVLESVGIPPRATGTKVALLAVGTAHLAAAVALAVGPGTWVGWFVLAVAAGGLWYLPFGTVADAAVIVIVLATSLRPW